MNIGCSDSFVRINWVKDINFFRLIIGDDRLFSCDRGNWLFDDCRDLRLIEIPVGVFSTDLIDPVT